MGGGGVVGGWGVGGRTGGRDARITGVPGSWLCGLPGSGYVLLYERTDSLVAERIAVLLYMVGRGWWVVGGWVDARACVGCTAAIQMYLPGWQGVFGSPCWYGTLGE